MGLPDKLRFVRLMLTAFGRKDWSEWMTAARQTWWIVSGPGSAEVHLRTTDPAEVRACPASEVSGAWLGARLHYREGSAPFGYIPGANWTKVLCEGLTRALEQAGSSGCGTRSPGCIPSTDASRAAELENGERVEGDVFVSTVPPEVYRTLVPGTRRR